MLQLQNRNVLSGRWKCARSMSCTGRQFDNLGPATANDLSLRHHMTHSNIISKYSPLQQTLSIADCYAAQSLLNVINCFEHAKPCQPQTVVANNNYRLLLHGHHGCLGMLTGCWHICHCNTTLCYCDWQHVNSVHIHSTHSLHFFLRPSRIEFCPKIYWYHLSVLSVSFLTTGVNVFTF